MKQPRTETASTRRNFLKAAAAAPLAATTIGIGLPEPSPAMQLGGDEAAADTENARRLAASAHEAPYEALRRFILPGQDEYAVEQTAAEIERRLGSAISNGQALPAAGSAAGQSPMPKHFRALAPDLEEAEFDAADVDWAAGWKRWVASLGTVRRWQFSALPDSVVRFEVSGEADGRVYHRVGRWRQVWSEGRLVEFRPLEEHKATASRPWFRDVTTAAFARCESFAAQLAKGIPYWRSTLDPATGIDVYGNNGIAVGDIDNDGLDEVYVCQPGGLPNRLYKFREDGTFEDITHVWNAGLVDDTSCALFLDLRNTGVEDLVVLRDSGPVLLLNRGDKFELRTDAFAFATAPAGAFTGMAAADYDKDGKLDLYLCTYVYFQTEAQYTYPSPYHDAQNGPPNFLFHNRLNQDGSGQFADVTAETGINENNNRFSFAPAWCDYNDDGWPDLFVANDFGRKNLYRNRDGRFHDVAEEAGVEDLGPGMSASWFDYDGDGRADLYVANMWSPSGQRVVEDPGFTPARDLKEAYRRHTKGNSLFRNRGDGSFEETTQKEHAWFARWAWSSGGHDLDNDGRPELVITCGMLTNASRTDLMSFFWRQVVSHAPVKKMPSAAYEGGWNAINQFAREEYSWEGNEPNVLHARRDGRFYDFSGVSGLDFAEDGRAFAVVDFDGDGRPDILLKNRLGPQVRVLQNACTGNRRSVGLKLIGTKSNRDAIGARVEVDGQVKWLAAGSGYLSQHGKTLLFGLGEAEEAKHVRILWPSGEIQELASLKAGYVYWVTEGEKGLVSLAMRVPRSLASLPVVFDNTLALRDTVFVDPLPLPEKIGGPALLIITSGDKAVQPQGAQHESVKVETVDVGAGENDRRRIWAIFRRYLFDWRAELETPFCLLLDKDGRALKVYAQVPSARQAAQDLCQLAGDCPAGEASAPAAQARGVFEGYSIKQPRRDFFKQGAAYLWSGYPEQALPYLEEVLRRTPENPRVLLLVGQIHARANRVDKARAALERALELNPNLAEAYAELAGLSENSHDWRGALSLYEKALEIKPDMVFTLLDAARMAETLGDNARNERYIRKALEADPQSADAENAMGLMLAKRDDFENARGHFQRAITLRRDDARAINNLGVLYMKAGRVDDAVAAFRYGIQAAPDDETLYLNLARIYAQRGEFDKARVTMQGLVERKPGSEVAKKALRELEGR
jgi:Flp pilus assembly protein TadD